MMRVPLFLLLAAWVDPARATWADVVTGWTSGVNEEEGINQEEHNFASLRFAVLLKVKEESTVCKDTGFPAQFFDELTEAVGLGMMTDTGNHDAHYDGSALIPKKLWDNTLHIAKRDMNGYGLTWKYQQGKAADTPGFRGRRQLSLHPSRKGVDRFCGDMFSAAPHNYYVQCACSAGQCDQRDQPGRRLHKKHQEGDRLLTEKSPEAIAVEEATMNRFSEKFNLPMIRMPKGEEAARVYIESKVHGGDWPGCLAKDAEPIVVVGMVFSPP